MAFMKESKSRQDFLLVVLLHMGACSEQLGLAFKF